MVPNAIRPPFPFVNQDFLNQRIKQGRVQLGDLAVLPDELDPLLGVLRRLLCVFHGRLQRGNNKREQLQREQGLRTQKMLTLDEVGRRLALGDFHELNVIVKGDVDGSVEALSDSLIKLSTEQVQVNVIHKGVGQISESDVSLAAASDAIIVGFQVRPSGAAAKLAEQEGVDIRKYSVIYDAIEEVKAAMEGMLAPTLKEQVTATIEVREVFNITKVGLVAGAMVKTGKVKRSDKARLIRDGIVIFTGAINALKRFKDDVKEVGTNFECGISLTNCNDIKVGDIIESYEEIEVKQTL